LLTEGIIAAAIVDGGVVAIAHTAARTERHADLGVATLPAWRGRGLATAAAALVAERVRAAGQIPVWSTGETNAASRRVAQKLGFREVARRTYLIR
jgi:predicted GNAT family acetyltransferase